MTDESPASENCWFAVWDDQGRVVGKTYGPTGMAHLLHPGKRILVGRGLDAETQWIDPNTMEIKERPPMNLTVDKTVIRADGVDAATITGIPEGAIVRLGSIAQTISGGALRFASPLPGAFVLLFASFPCQDAEIIIHAHP